MDIKKQFGTDKKKEHEGVWIPTGTDSKLLIARVGNKNYMEAFKRLSAPHKVSLRNRNLPPDIAEKIAVEAIAESILLGWEGLTEDGKKIPYSKEQAIRLLTTYPDFAEQVGQLANDIENFKGEQEAATAKN